MNFLYAKVKLLLLLEFFTLFSQNIFKQNESLQKTMLPEYIFKACDDAKLFMLEDKPIVFSRHSLQMCIDFMNS